MGQIVTFFQEVPHIIEEVMNIVLIALSLLAILKGVYNLATCGIIGLITFSILCGRSCSEVYKGTYNLSSIELDAAHLNQTMPLSCSKNNSHHYIFVNNTGLEITLTNTSLLNHKFCNLSDAHKKNLYDHALMSIVTTFHLSIPNFGQYEAMSCDFNGGNITIQYNLSHASVVDAGNHCGTLANGILDVFMRMFWGHSLKTAISLPRGDGGGTQDCIMTSYQYLIIQNISWEDHCIFSKPSPMGFISLMSQKIKSIYISRRILGTFTWTLSDSSGNELPGGYCLEKWMLVSAELKCFGNTAIAKCNLNHDEEFCDMLRLFDFNKQAIDKLRIEAQRGLNLITKAVNSLVSDQLIMRNHLRDLMGIPYCNYTKFWFLNDTRTGRTSLPKCWKVSNNTYLNETEFSTEIEQEADNMITEVLQKEYLQRQGKTPLGLVDLFVFSTSFYLITVFLHLIKIPTHRHIQGRPCPKPHRLNSMAVCSCGAYGHPGLPVKWSR
nr:glycoprotein precursor [Mammarenavirus marientalense]